MKQRTTPLVASIFAVILLITPDAFARESRDRESVGPVTRVVKVIKRLLGGIATSEFGYPTPPIPKP